MLAQHFAPEDVSGAVLATELASDLVEKGHQVTFVTCAPNYPDGRVFPGYRNRLISREVIQHVKVVRVWCYITPKMRIWHRLINYATFSMAAFWGGLFSRKPDLIFSYSPPLPLGLSAWILSKLWGVPWILRVEDLFPQIAVHTGVIKHPMLIKISTLLEMFLYQRATHISLITNSFLNNLVSRGVDRRKCSVTPVWADPSLVQPQFNINGFKQEYGIEDKFIILYTGNFGYTSNLEDIILAADLLRNNRDIHFVLVGEGIKKNDLVEMTRKRSLENILFLPYQPRREYSAILSAADIGLVTLNEASSNASLPSKVFNIMASEKPILAIAPPDSDLVDLVRQVGCGFDSPPGRHDQLAKMILDFHLSRETLKQMGVLGRQAIINTYNRKNIVNQFEQIMQSTIK